MASNPSGQKTGENLVAKLESRIRALQMENQTLRRQIVDAKNDADARNRYLGELQYRSRQRRRNKAKLASAFYWVRTAQYITGMIAMILGFYVGVPTMAGISIFDKFPKQFRYYFVWKINDKWCSLLTGFVGFFISIPAQRTFPAPIRVFYVTVVFGIKQILDIFLPTQDEQSDRRIPSDPTGNSRPFDNFRQESDNFR
jgi:hypothetical protein